MALVISTSCDECLHKKVCGRKLLFRDLVTNTRNALIGEYRGDVDAMLKGLNTDMSFSCKDWMPDTGSTTKR